MWPTTNSSNNFSYRKYFVFTGFQIIAILQCFITVLNCWYSTWYISLPGKGVVTMQNAAELALCSSCRQDSEVFAQVKLME